MSCGDNWFDDLVGALRGGAEQLGKNSWLQLSNPPAGWRHGCLEESNGPGMEAGGTRRALIAELQCVERTDGETDCNRQILAL